MPRRKRGPDIGRFTTQHRRKRERQNVAAATVEGPAEHNMNHVLYEQNNTGYRNLQNEFEDNLRSLQFYECVNCSRVLMQQTFFDMCPQCKRNPNKFTAVNRMDPKDVPTELMDLTYVEQLLIARVQPVMRVYRVKSRGFPGQYAYKGNIINIGQNITEIVSSLPRTPASLSTIVVRKESVNGHRDFHVRRDKILEALNFLKVNNPFYSDIIIDIEQISQLPLNDSIYGMIPTVDLPEVNTDEENFSEEIYESMIPENIRIREVDRLQSAVNNVIPWPQGTDIINEFSCEGYLSMAFPALLPYGSAELNDNTRASSMKLTALEYFQFLMQYKDRRFAQDPRFRFFALNTVQRHQAIQRGTIFARKSHFNGTIQQLRNTLSSNPQIVRSLYYWCGKIRGSKSYWFQRRSELESMIEQCDNLPTGFFTLSAADLWWPDLARLMGCNVVQEETLDESRIAQQRQKLINENPSIVEDYFSFRATLFIKNVVCKIFSVLDYWFRFEFQHRGSCHVHGLLWISGAPDPRTFDNASEEDILSAKMYYDHLVNALNPLPFTPPATIHPSRIRSTDVVIDNDRSLSELLNRFQRHTRCTKGYCLKWNGKEYTCRFKYPKELQQQSLLEKNEKGIWIYTPIRNDELLNQYNPVIAQTWRANTDFSIITSLYQVVEYVSKYASKSEPASKNLTEMFQEIVESRAPDEQSRRAYTSLMIRVIGERDIGACETCHLLYGIPLYQCTRTFRILVITIEDYVAITGTNSENDSNSFIRFYNSRPLDMEEITLFDFAKKYSKGRNNSISTNRKEKIVQVFPKVNNSNNAVNTELYCKQKLILHKHWRKEEDLKSTDTPWFMAYTRQNFGQFHEQLHMSLITEETEIDQDNNNEFDIFDDRDWMAIAAVMPNALPTHVGLGNRDIDLLHNWEAAYYKYPDIKNKTSFIERNRETFGNQYDYHESYNVIFNDQQNKILSFLDYQLNDYDDCNQRLAVIQGKAGTGKSCVINEMVRRINSYFGCDATLLMAPTGVAANNIAGHTIHSALRINTSKKRGGTFKDLEGESKIAFEEELKDVRFVIIDEASMLGLNLFFKVDMRLKQAKQRASAVPFGGLCVYLVGDWSQLPPVCDKSLYNIGNNVQTIQSNLLYKQFKKVFFLTEIMRQQGDDQQNFRETLNRVANGTITEQDYQLLSKRFYVNNIGDNFKDSICIMSKNAEIERFNYEKLESNEEPVALINAIHNCPEASLAKSDDAQGLFAQLRLCKGARVILRRNLWVTKGLANGSVGTVTDIIYEPAVECANYNDHMPICILVAFEKYTGPVLYENSIPIVPVVASFKKNEISCTRKQFPLMLAYAVSIHRSQGITLDKAIVNLGDNEFQVGLTYVALSRVTTLEGLLLKPAFNFDRLLKINRSPSMVDRRDELQRLWNMSNDN